VLGRAHGEHQRDRSDSGVAPNRSSAEGKGAGGVLHEAVQFGRLALAPLQPVSTYSPAISDPRRAAYSRSSRNCISQVWSVVLTLGVERSA
jgi:hypothetical protein